jgi:hypothetical protein
LVISKFCEKYFLECLQFLSYEVFRGIAANVFRLCDVVAFRVRQFKFSTKVQYSSLVQHLFISHHIAKPMLAVSARLTVPMFLFCVASKVSLHIV